MILPFLHLSFGTPLNFLSLYPLYSTDPTLLCILLLPLLSPSFSFTHFLLRLFLDLRVSLCPSLPPSSLLFLPLLNMFTLSQNNNANQQCNTSIWVEYCKDFLESYKINFNAKENERLLDPALKNRQLEYQI